MSEPKQTYSSQFSIGEFEPFEILKELREKRFETQMMEIQEQNIDKIAHSTQIMDLDGLVDFLNHDNSTAIQENQNLQQRDQLDTSQNTSEALRDLRVKRLHLNRSRRTKDTQKCELELQIKGYWTKNFLQNCKKPHFKWLQKQLGREFFKQNPDIENIRLKEGITMDEYLILYKYQNQNLNLKSTWEKFFATKYLHREVMLSRQSNESKLVFLKFHHRFEEAFKTGQFDHIA